MNLGVYAMTSQFIARATQTFASVLVLCAAALYAASVLARPGDWSALIFIAPIAHAACIMFALSCPAYDAARGVFRPWILFHVQPRVLCTIQQFKILWSIVALNLIAMMHGLIKAKTTTNNALHDKAVLKDGSPVWGVDDDIPMVGNTSSAFPVSTARRTRLRAADLAGDSGGKNLLALRACFGYGTFEGHHNLLRYGVMLRAAINSAGALLCSNYSIGKPQTL